MPNFVKLQSHSQLLIFNSSISIIYSAIILNFMSMKIFLSVICLLLSINLFSNSSLTNKEVFWENKGQVTGKDAKKVKYYLNDQNFTLFLLDNGLSYQFKKTHSPTSFQSADKFSDILNFKRNNTD
jgi:hypothetical protein